MLRRMRRYVGARLRRRLAITAPPPTVWQVMAPGDGHSWAGRHVAIAGASGHLGSHLVRSLIGLGAQVYAIDSDLDALETLGREHRDPPRLLRADLTDTEAVGGVAREIAAQTSALDALINCTAWNDYPSEHEPIHAEAWNRALAVNLIAPALVTDALVPLLAQVKGAGIVMVCSVNGRLPSPWRHYAAAKAGLTKLTADLAATLSGHGIRVNSVSPGWFTAINPDGTTPRDRLSPLTSSATPVEAVVHSILFLADARQSPCTTGQDLGVGWAPRRAHLPSPPGAPPSAIRG